MLSSTRSLWGCKEALSDCVVDMGMVIFKTQCFSPMHGQSLPCIEGSEGDRTFLWSVCVKLAISAAASWMLTAWDCCLQRPPSEPSQPLTRLIQINPLKILCGGWCHSIRVAWPTGPLIFCIYVCPFSIPFPSLVQSGSHLEGPRSFPICTEGTRSANHLTFCPLVSLYLWSPEVSKKDTNSLGKKNHSLNRWSFILWPLESDYNILTF